MILLDRRDADRRLPARLELVTACRDVSAFVVVLVDEPVRDARIRSFFLSYRNVGSKLDGSGRAPWADRALPPAATVYAASSCRA